MEAITKQDLHEFREALLADIQKLITEKATPEPPLLVRSSVIRKTLNISAGTLFNMRVSGAIKGRKIGGSYYYNLREVEGMFTKKNSK